MSPNPAVLTWPRPVSSGPANPIRQVKTGSWDYDYGDIGFSQQTLATSRIVCFMLWLPNLINLNGWTQRLTSLLSVGNAQCCWFDRAGGLSSYETVKSDDDWGSGTYIAMEVTNGAYLTHATPTQNATTTSLTIPSMTVSSAPAIAFAGVGTDTSSSLANISSWTNGYVEAGDVSNGTANGYLAAAYRVMSSTGSTTTIATRGTTTGADLVAVAYTFS